jgi:hypothetical protein
MVGPADAIVNTVAIVNKALFIFIYIRVKMVVGARAASALRVRGASIQASPMLGICEQCRPGALSWIHPCFHTPQKSAMQRAKIIIEKIIQGCHKIADKMAFIIVERKMTRFISRKLGLNNS